MLGKSSKKDCFLYIIHIGDKELNVTVWWLSPLFRNIKVPHAFQIANSLMWFMFFKEFVAIYLQTAAQSSQTSKIHVRYWLPSSDLFCCQKKNHKWSSYLRHFNSITMSCVCPESSSSGSWINKQNDHSCVEGKNLFCGSTQLLPLQNMYSWLPKFGRSQSPSPGDAHIIIGRQLHCQARP